MCELIPDLFSQVLALSLQMFSVCTGVQAAAINLYGSCVQLCSAKVGCVNAKGFDTVHGCDLPACTYW